MLNASFTAHGLALFLQSGAVAHTIPEEAVQSATHFIATRAGHYASSWGGSIKRTLPDHLPIYVCALVFCIATIAIASAYRVPLPLEAATYFLVLIPKFLLLGLALGAARQLVLLVRAGSHESPTRAIGRWLAKLFFQGDRPGNVFHTLLAFTPLMISFAALKNEVPLIHPFAWDATFMHWDSIIGFGRQPWEVLQTVLGYAPITWLVNLIYDSWFLVMFGCFFWQAFAPSGSRVRAQYLLAFSLSWFLAGNLLAAWLSSAGPCFYGHLFAGIDPYAGQMTYLHEVNQHWPIWSVPIQDSLWHSYVTGSGEISGISAMPSMHVESSALMAFLGWRVSRKLGIALTVYTALIFIGSIHLAWHYATDGIVGIGLAALFWVLAGVMLEWYGHVRAASRLQTASAA